MKVLIEKYSATHLANLSKYKDTQQLDFYVYDHLLDSFITEHNLVKSELSCIKDILIYKGVEIGVVSLRRIGYNYTIYMSVTEEFYKEYSKRNDNITVITKGCEPT